MRHRHARDERLELGLGRDHAALALVQARRAREERRGVAVGADADEREGDRDVVDQRGRSARRPPPAPSSPSDRGAPHGAASTAPGASRARGGSSSARRPAARSARRPTRRRRARPVGLERRRGARRRAPRPSPRPRGRWRRRRRRRLGEQRPGRGRRRRRRRGSRPLTASPAASSRERSIAAWIAFRNAARTPARSSSRIARIVVPPGEVTISRSSTGCMCSSRSSFAVPSIVWTTSCVDISRERPSRIPASIIASASSAKYAGPEPETAVTASMYALRHAHDRADVGEHLLGERQVRVVGVGARADAGHALVHRRRRVRHRAHDRDALCEVRLDRRRRDRRRDRQHGLLGRRADRRSRRAARRSPAASRRARRRPRPAPPPGSRASRARRSGSRSSSTRSWPPAGDDDLGRLAPARARAARRAATRRSCRHRGSRSAARRPRSDPTRRSGGLVLTQPPELVLLTGRSPRAQPASR